MKYNFENHRKRIQALTPTWEIGVFYLAIAMFFLSVDLNLEKFQEFNAVVILVEFTYFLFWIIDMLVFVFIKVRRDKTHARETESTK